MKYFDRDEELIKIAQNKTVLHLGCVGFADSDNKERILLAKKSLHFTLTNISQVTGIDYCNEAIEYFKEHGVFDNVLHGNVEYLDDINLDRIFDVIIAGDILEHLSNPGLMLEGIKRFSDNNTLLIITTPHSFGLLNYIRFILNKFREGNEHMMTFNLNNIENLLTRHNYEVKSIDTCHQKHAKNNKLLFIFGKLFFSIFPKFGGTLFIAARINVSNSTD